MAIIKLKGKTLEQWLSLDPVLIEREIVIETDTNKLKIGDGVKKYSELGYVFQASNDVPEEGMEDILDAYVTDKKIYVPVDTGSADYELQYTEDGKWRKSWLRTFAIYTVYNDNPTCDADYNRVLRASSNENYTVRLPDLAPLLSKPPFSCTGKTVVIYNAAGDPLTVDRNGEPFFYHGVNPAQPTLPAPRIVYENITIPPYTAYQFVYGVYGLGWCVFILNSPNILT